MEIIFFTNIPENRDNLDVSYSAEIYFSDELDAEPILTRSEGVPFDEFKAEILAAVLASVLSAGGDVLTIDGETIEVGSEEDIVDEYFGDGGPVFENEEND
jgi:hypothetical protein